VKPALTADEDLEWLFDHAVEELQHRFGYSASAAEALTRDYYQRFRDPEYCKSIHLGVEHMTRSDALDIAKVECRKRAILWKEPCIAQWGIFSYTVRTNSDCRGSNVVIRIRKRDGAILSLVELPK